MEINELLRKLGLTSKEVSVYVTLLEKGYLTVSGIAKHSGLHRPTIYQILPNLKKKGLVAEAPKGKLMRYTAESPEKLKNMINELTGELEKMLPELNSIFSRNKNKPLVKFLEGKRGIAFVMDDIIHTFKRGDTLCIYSSEKAYGKSKKYTLKDYEKIMDQKQIQRFVITNESETTLEGPKLDVARKVIPEKYGLFDYGITQIIYENKVAYIDFNTETVFLIENPVIDDFQKKIFKILFDLLPGGLK